MTADPEAARGSFFALGPDAVLDAVEQAGQRTTGLCYALNSLENRVYEVELDGGRRVVVKFYRPGRWSRETIADEHRLLLALAAAEIPVCAPLPLEGERTLGDAAGIAFALFRRTGGRAPEELEPEEFEQLGRLLARIHGVARSLALPHRPALDARTYGTDALAAIHAHVQISPGVGAALDASAGHLVALATERLAGVRAQVVHADCHRGNLLRGRDGFFFLDFDDCARAPVVQDLWLLLPARPEDCPRERDALVEGYLQFGDLDLADLRLVELLRGLRYLRYAAWIATRWADPSFPRAFPQFGSDAYWQTLRADLDEQVERAG